MNSIIGWRCHLFHTAVDFTWTKPFRQLQSTITGLARALRPLCYIRSSDKILLGRFVCNRRRMSVDHRSKAIKRSRPTLRVVYSFDQSSPRSCLRASCPTTSLYYMPACYLLCEMRAQGPLNGFVVILGFPGLKYVSCKYSLSCCRAAATQGHLPHCNKHVGIQKPFIAPPDTYRNQIGVLLHKNEGAENRGSTLAAWTRRRSASSRQAEVAMRTCGNRCSGI